MKRELDPLGMFLTKACDYGRRLGFNDQFLIEPKPMEPITFQYDADSAIIISFLRK